MAAWTAAALRPCATRGDAVRDNNAVRGAAVRGAAAIELRRADNIGSGRMDDIVQGRVVLRRTNDIVLWGLVRRMSGPAAIAVPLTAVPAVPAVAAAPTVPAAPRVVAPVPARALPTVVVPTEVVAEEEELRVFNRKDLS